MSMTLRGPWPVPYTTFAWFWEFPLIRNGPLSYEQIFGTDPSVIPSETLELYGNPELNNDGGLFTPARDFGWIGFGPFWLLYGFLAGKSYRGFLRGSLAGCLIYPLFIMALLELPRLSYLTATRTFPSLMLFFILLIWLARREQSLIRLAGLPAAGSI
jgi:hypothetical protein